MSTITRPRPSSAALAIVLILGLNALAFAAHWEVAAQVSNGLSRFFIEGGPWMYPVAMLLLLQCAAGVLLGVLHVYRRVPLPLYLLVPALVVLMGALGGMLGDQQAIAAIAQAAPDQQLPMWSMSLAIAGFPRTYAFLVLFVGGLSMLAGTSMAAFVRRTPGQHGSLGLGVGAAALVAAGVCTGLGIYEARLSGDLLRPLHFGIVLLLASPFLALAAPGLGRLSSSGDEAERAMALPLVLGQVLGLVLAIVALAAAFQSSGQSKALQALASAPPDMRAAMFSASLALAVNAKLFGAIALGAALLASAPLLVLSFPVAPSWFRQHPLQVVGVLLLLSSPIAALWLGARPAIEHNRELVEKMSLHLPASLALPASSSQRPAYVDDGVLILKNGVLSENQPAQASPESPTNARLEKLLRALHGEMAEGPALALDPSTSGETLRDLATALYAAGTRRLTLLVSSRDFHGGSDGPPPKLRVLWGGGGLAGELRTLFEEQSRVRSVRVRLAETLAEIAPKGRHDPSRQLLLELDGAEVTISGGGGELHPAVPATPEGAVDRSALGEKLVKFKDAFPDENTVALHFSARTTLQQLIDAQGAARGSGPDKWDRRALFRDAVWVSSAQRPASAAPRPLDTSTRGLGAGTRTGGLGKSDLGGRGNRGETAAGSSVVMGSLDRGVIARIVERHKKEVAYCYERELMRRPQLRGKLKLKFTISAAGAVTVAKIASSTFDNPAVGNCLVRRVKRWRFPPPKGGGLVTVSYPFVFHPAN